MWYINIPLFIYFHVLIVSLIFTSFIKFFFFWRIMQHCPMVSIIQESAIQQLLVFFLSFLLLSVSWESIMSGKREEIKEKFTMNLCKNPTSKLSLGKKKKIHTQRPTQPQRLYGESTNFYENNKNMKTQRPQKSLHWESI